MVGSRLAVAVLAMAAAGPCTGCGQTPIPCTVDLEVERDTRTVTVTDCDGGSFTVGDVNYTDEAILNAQKCVLNSITQKHPFKLVYDASDPSGELTSGLRAAFVGTMRGGVLSLRSYAGQGHGDMSSAEDFVSTLDCQSIVATDSTTCTPKVGMPCLTCVPGPDDVGSVSCRGS